MAQVAGYADRAVQGDRGRGHDFGQDRPRRRQAVILQSLHRRRKSVTHTLPERSIVRHGRGLCALDSLNQIATALAQGEHLLAQHLEPSVTAQEQIIATVATQRCIKSVRFSAISALLYFIHLQDFVTVVVDDFDGELAGVGLVERAADGRIER